MTRGVRSTRAWGRAPCVMARAWAPVSRARRVAAPSANCVTSSRFVAPIPAARRRRTCVGQHATGNCVRATEAQPTAYDNRRSIRHARRPTRHTALVAPRFNRPPDGTFKRLGSEQRSLSSTTPRNGGGYALAPLRRARMCSVPCHPHHWRNHTPRPQPQSAPADYLSPCIHPIAAHARGHATRHSCA